MKTITVYRLEYNRIKAKFNGIENDFNIIEYKTKNVYNGASNNQCGFLPTDIISSKVI